MRTKFQIVTTICCAVLILKILTPPPFVSCQIDVNAMESKTDDDLPVSRDVVFRAPDSSLFENFFSKMWKKAIILGLVLAIGTEIYDYFARKRRIDENLKNAAVHDA